MKLTVSDIFLISRGCDAWFEPVGREWRSCDKLVKAGWLKHNGAARGKGERYAATDAGRNAVGKPLPPPPSPAGAGGGQ